MSEQAPEREYVELPNSGDAAFSALLDALAPEEGTPESPGAGDPAGAGGAADSPAADPGTGAAGSSPEPPGQPASGAEQPPADPAGQAGGDPGGDPDGSAQPEGEPAPPPFDFSAITSQLGTLSSKIENGVLESYKRQALVAIREEYPQYIEALEKHPRLLVGTQVPAVGREGTETLKDSNDAREWQEAVKTVLVAEIDSRAQNSMSEARDYLETVHGSIDLFKNNLDLIPGTPGFDRELADSFARMAAPYEVRVDGKLTGYSIPVQPLIDNLRSAKAVERQPAAPSQPAGAPAGSGPAPAVEPPQAGIPSKAGSSTEKEDFSTLFGTIGLPNIKI